MRACPRRRRARAEEFELRLTQIKLAGFKSFVDPTSIATPGQLVGIVGPNGCGKSNVIDAVRWVLGESKASALRGESMQDVIFNGAGDRAPVGRAAVELYFDNSQGRIGGQWGSYSELSIKRVLTRDGDSTYYINNIPVRRRDIHDLFLGTGLGPRAYAIIEQGMIARVIEARPEELRVFLEEAAGVSKYRERRRETESRIADTRKNLARVEDIRIELGAQLARLDAQAKVATEYRDLESRLKQAQHLLWFARQQDAVRARERQAAEIANLAAAFEALQADLRAVENRLEGLRADHYKAGDELHEKQGGFYAANAEVTRIEQQLAFARESEGRLAQQVAQVTEQIAAFTAQLGTMTGDARAGEQDVERAIAQRESAVSEEQAAVAALPQLEIAVADAARAMAAVAQRIGEIEQELLVADTQRENAVKVLGAIAQRRERLESESQELALPTTTQIDTVTEQLQQETADLADRGKALAELNEIVHSLQAKHRATSDAWQLASSALAEREARAQALSDLQAKIGGGKDAAAWFSARGLEHTRRLWQQLDIERGWEDALEAVLRERLNALEMPSLDAVLDWAAADAALPGRIAAYTTGNAERGSEPRGDTLLGKVRVRQPQLARLLADWLHGVHCRGDLGTALRERASLSPGESFVVPSGHVVNAQGVSFFAPDSELHGVLARQRELLELEQAIGVARAETAASAAARSGAEAELNLRQQEYHGENMALSSQQRRCHDLELELMQLKQAAETAERRRAQIADELGVLGREEAVEREAVLAVDASLRTGRERLDAEFAGRDSARHVVNEAEVALARGRERVRVAERAAQEAGFAERSCRERLAELARRRESLEAQLAQQQGLLTRVAAEREGIDWTPVETALQAQLTVRAAAEQALAASRDRLEAIGTDLRAAEEARLVGRPETRARAREDRRSALEGTGRGAGRTAVRGTAGRGACRPRGATRADEGLGPRQHAAG